METKQIDKLLSTTEFPSAKITGCVSFAVAMDRVFGADSFPCAFDPWDDSKPLHCMVMIDGVVFDADGEHGTDPEYVQNWWDGLKPNDFNYVVNKAEETGRDRWVLMIEHLQECAYANIDASGGIDNLGAVEHDVERYKNIIEEELENMNR